MHDCKFHAKAKNAWISVSTDLTLRLVFENTVTYVHVFCNFIFILLITDQDNITCDFGK